MRERERMKNRGLWLALMIVLVAVGSAMLAGLSRAEEQERPEGKYGYPTAPEAFHATYVRGHCGLYTAYVIEYLTPERLKGNADRKGLPFLPDEDVPKEFRATLADYRGSHLDRGHMAPAGDARHGRDAMAETFLLSNMFGQEANLNRGPWKELEHHVRDEIAGEPGTEVWSITLPLFVPDDDGTIHVRTFGRHRLWRPTHTAKVILVRRGKQLTMQAWKCPNVSNPPPWNRCETTVDEIEAESGLNLFDGLPDDVEDELEAREPQETDDEDDDGRET